MQKLPERMDKLRNYAKNFLIDFDLLETLEIEVVPEARPARPVSSMSSIFKEQFDFEKVFI